MKNQKRTKVKIAIKIDIYKKNEVKSIKIKISIMDKIISYTIVDDSSGLNIMLFQTIKKLRLNITSLSFFIIKMENQSLSILEGQIKNCKTQIEREEYALIYHVIEMHMSKDFFLSLLSRPWFKDLEAIVNQRRRKPHIIFGLQKNRTKISI